MLQSEKPERAPTHPVRRRTRRGDERCERVRAVAADLFLARGYDGVSLDEIIAQAGGSKSNVYSQFGGKEGLFLSVMERVCDELMAPLSALDLSGLSFEDGLRIFAQTLLTTLFKERNLALYRLLIGESVRFPGVGQIWSSCGPETSHRILAEFLSRDAQSGQGAAVDPLRAAVLFHNMVLNTPLTRAIFGVGGLPGPEEIKHLVNEAVLIFTRGLRP